MNDTTSNTMHHAETMRDLTTDELQSVGGGLYGSLVFLRIAEIPNFCPPTASYAPLCPH